MSADPGLISSITGPTSTPPLILPEERSESVSFLYDETNAVWWRFTAPSAGVYGFDTALSSVDGVTDGDEPVTFMGALSVSPLIQGQVTGTSCSWIAFELDVGQTIDIYVIAVSSMDDLLGSTLRPVDVSLRSSGISSVEEIIAPTPPAESIVVVGSSSLSSSGTLSYPSGTTEGDIVLLTAYSEGLTLDSDMYIQYDDDPIKYGGNVVSGSVETKAIADIKYVSEPPTGPVLVNFGNGSGAATMWVVRFPGYQYSPGSGEFSRSGMIQSPNVGGSLTQGDDAYVVPPSANKYTPQSWSFSPFPTVVPEDTTSVVWRSPTSLACFISLQIDPFSPGSGLSTSNYGFTSSSWDELPGSGPTMQAFVFEGSPFFERDVPGTVPPFLTAVHTLSAVVPHSWYEYTPGDYPLEEIHVIRQYPRDDQYGFSGSPRIFPPPKGRYPNGARTRSIGGFD